MKNERQHEAETHESELWQGVDENGAEKDVMKSDVGEKVA